MPDVLISAKARIAELEREPGLVRYPGDDARTLALKFGQEARRRSELAKLYDLLGKHTKASAHRVYADMCLRSAADWAEVAREDKLVVNVLTVGAPMRVVHPPASSRSGDGRALIRAVRSRRTYHAGRASFSRRRRSGLVRGARSPDRESEPDPDIAKPRAGRPYVLAVAA
jgi:hypothetical protein